MRAVSAPLVLCVFAAAVWGRLFASGWVTPPSSPSCSSSRLSMGYCSHSSSEQVAAVAMMGRRRFLATSAVGVTISSAAAPVLANAPAWGPEGNPDAAESWFGLILKQKGALLNLLDTWDETAGPEGADGDALRRKLGTVGVSSPLSAIKKTYSGIRDASVISDEIDIVDFAEYMQDVLTDLSDADNDLYSANFADFSGGGHLKGRNFVKKAKVSVLAAQKHLDQAISALNI